jgi:tight adherence protein B
VIGAWLALGLAALLWPAGAPANRIRRLVAHGRLNGRPVAGASPARIGLRVGRRLSVQRLSVRRAASTGWPWGLFPRSTARLVCAGAGGGVCVALVGSVGPPGAIMCGATATIVVAAAVSVIGTDRRRRVVIAREAEVGLAVALLQGELEAGCTPAAALLEAGPIGAQLTDLVAPDAADQHGDQRGHVPGDGADSALDSVVVAWRMSESTGVPLVEVLARVRSDLAAQATTRRAVAAAVAGPRASAALLAGLPLLGIAMGAAMGAHPLTVLGESAGGRLLLCTGLILDALGLVWTDRLIARAERR